MAEQFRAGGYGYGMAKKSLLEAIVQTFAPFRERRKELAAHPDDVEQILLEGAKKAREHARGVLDRARWACGIASTNERR